MAVKHPPLAGELVTLDPEDQSSARRAFSRPPGSKSAPTQQIGAGPQGQRRPMPNAPEQRDYSKRMCLAIWHGGGWVAETLEMLEGFFEHDGQQDRSCYILQTPINPTPREVVLAAQRAFTDVRIVETMFGNPADGVITPHALYDFAGLIPQKLGHKARIFYTMPIKVVGPNALARLEQEAYQANPGRAKDNTNLGKPILGALRQDSKGEKFPFSSFVALPTWVGEPAFPLFKGLEKQPAKTAAQIPMNHLRFELLRNMAVTPLINPEPWKMPSDPRFVLLEGRQFGERFPQGIPAAQAPIVADEVSYDPPTVAQLVAKQEPTPIPTLNWEPRETLGLPPHAEIEERIMKEGLGWLSAYECPTDLTTLRIIHNAERRRTAPPAELESAPTQSVVKQAQAKKPTKKAKPALTVPSA